MAAAIFSTVLSRGYAKKFKAGEVEIIDWFRNKALNTHRTSIKRVLEKTGAKQNTVSHITIGRPVMYRYDPKHKLTLPYYDTFPIIFPIEKYKDGWLGINLHYLPPVYRARLMDALHELANNDKYDESTKLVLNYKMLKTAAKFRYFKPCVKRYLHSHVKSSLVEISPAEWDYMLFLPLARFHKAQQRTVWDESVRNIMASK